MTFVTETAPLNIHGLLGGECLRGEHAEEWRDAINAQVELLTAAIDPVLAAIRKTYADKKRFQAAGKQEVVEQLRAAGVAEVNRITEKQRPALQQAISAAREAMPTAAPPPPTDSAVVMAEAECRNAVRAIFDRSMRYAAIETYARIAHPVAVPAILHDPLFPGDAALLSEEERQQVLDLWLEAKYPGPFQKLQQVTTVMEIFEGNVQRALAVIGGPLNPNPAADRLAEEAAGVA